MSSPSAPFPSLTASDILRFQFSSWYPIFSALSIKSTVIRPLPQDFVEYLHDDAHGVFLPEGSDDVPAESTLSDDEGEDSDTEEEGHRRFAFPELDAQIRECIKTYGAVFPKLNFSSPKVVDFRSFTITAEAVMVRTHPGCSRNRLLVNARPPQTCTCSSSRPTSSRTTSQPSRSLRGCTALSGPDPHPYELELVLRKWYPVDRSRELRCFVRQNVLIGVSQRDTNYYDFLNDAPTRARIVSSVRAFWETNIKTKWEGPQDCVYFTPSICYSHRDLSRGHILDFNPYAPRTDPLLFSYDELHPLAHSSPSDADDAPELRVIDSRAHPAATSAAPAHQHNMIPFEALSMSSGRDIEEFAEAWKEGIVQSVVDED
ncbi:hypothetical protein MVEN_00398200 [Mycena venus]|uniref:Cell division cycle protein 123 n=1 Tax=Mycena venus TaxID=2733690 RepID=A0A8H6YU57_9AGAR|nr:hypothetical protein MVEN_00398200 [Mycena venus]